MIERTPQHREAWQRLIVRLLPFADAASDDLPLGRLLRLSLFQLSCGMVLVLLNGTLNRVMIIELGVPAWLVSTMIALPLVFAPVRALIGFRSDHHRSVIGWRRSPYIWMGSLIQFGGLAIMPFALLLLSGDGNAPPWLATAAAALAFLLTGAGLHIAQTAGLALATDIAADDKRPQVVALLYVTLLTGMLVSALAFGLLLSDFTQIRLIQLVQGAAVLTLLLNCVALWKQEARQPNLDRQAGTPGFLVAWRQYAQAANGHRFLVAVLLGTVGFSMQDILLEPYGGDVLKLSVGGTTLLTAILAGGSLMAFAIAAMALARNVHPIRLAATGILFGVAAFTFVIFSDPLQSPALFRFGTALIGFGSGLFGVSTLTLAMTMVGEAHRGLSLGAWGAAQASASGVGIALGGLIRDNVSALSSAGAFGSALTHSAVGYSVVYHLEIALLFLAMAALGPLYGSLGHQASTGKKLSITAFPT